VNDVAIGIIRILAGGHYDEKAFSCVNDLDIMNGQTIVEGDGNNRLHRAFIEEFADFDICDLHEMSPIF
jgi:hypothetical protein